MIQLYIQEQYKVFYSPSGISRLMARLKLAKIRPKTIAGKSPSLEKQVQFVLRYFQVDAFAQLDPGVIQLFGDGMHLHHQLIPSLCWGDPKDPPVLPTNSNRKRLNILGAYDPKKHRFVHHTSEDNCDGKKVVKYLKIIKKRFAHHHTIILYLDNAPYFHAPVVKKWLKVHPEFFIESLPTYSPNLNLIERFWKLVKAKLVNNRYYEKYKTFRAKTFQLLNHVNQHFDELKTLMTEKFQLIWQY